MVKSVLLYAIRKLPSLVCLYVAREHLPPVYMRHLNCSTSFRIILPLRSVLRFFPKRIKCQDSFDIWRSWRDDTREGKGPPENTVNLNVKWCRAQEDLRNKTPVFESGR